MFVRVKHSSLSWQREYYREKVFITFWTAQEERSWRGTFWSCLSGVHL